MEAISLLHDLGDALSALAPYWQVLGLLLALGATAALGVVVDPITLEKGLKTNFFKAYDAATPFYPTLATEVPSTATSEKYGWLGTAPAMREWVDERLPKGLLDHDYTITNNHYEATLAVDRDDLEDDQTNQINLRVQDMGARARRHPDALLTTLIEAGTSTLCYDGQYFFDDDHSEGDSGTLDNNLTYNASDHTAVTQAEFAAAFNVAITTMLEFKDDRGQPFLEEWELNSQNLICMVSPTLRKVALETFTAGLISSTDNINRNLATLRVNARLTSSVTMYLFYVGAPVKPFIFQNRQPIRTGFLGDQSDAGFMRRYYHYGVDARYNVGYGLWQFAVLTTFN